MQKQAKHYFDFGDFRIDVEERTLRRQDNPVALTPKAFDTLLVLVENSGRVLEKEELFNRVWPDTFVGEVTLARNISTLRQALADPSQQRRYIETVPRRGYRFIAEVREVREGEAELIRAAIDAHMPGGNPPVGAHRLFIERHSVSQVVTEQEEIDDSLRGEAMELLPGKTLPNSRPHWIASKWGTVMVAVLLTASASILAVYLWTRHTRQTALAAAIRSVAVLPLKIMNAEQSDEYLGIGITDRLIDLSNLSQVVVRPMSAVLKYAAREADAIEAGRELNVEGVLVGSVQKSGERMRTNLQLVRVSDGAVLWVKTFDEKFVNLLELEDEIADQAARAMRLELGENERRRIASRGTTNTEAYNAHMRGRFFWSKRTEEGLKKAIEYFEQAIERDSNYAQAYSGLADSYVLLGTYNVLSPSHAMPKAEAAAMKALDIDGGLAEAHTSLAYVRFRYGWRWDDAEKEFVQAIKLNPNYTTAHHWYGDFLVAMGRFDEAIAEMRVAQGLDPLSMMINTDLGGALAIAGALDEAIAVHLKTIEMDPHFVPAHRYLGQAYEQKAMYREAIGEFLESLTASPDDPDGLTLLAHAYAIIGNKREMRKILDRLSDISKRHYVAPYDLAPIYAALGDKDQAFVWLQRAYDQRCEGLTLLKIDSSLKSLRMDPRFVALIRRVGLPT
jgi:DNA-binding winged helix-turn-helix (wHTH) protein/tetratricopeptide (TPR) repeat protein